MKYGGFKMKRKVDRALLAGLILLLFVSLFPVQDGGAQQRNNFLWSVRSKTTTVYILGSIHFLRQADYPLNPAIETAFNGSNTLVVEANVNDPGKQDLQNLLTSAVYPGNDTLQKHLSPEVYRLVEQEAGNLGLPIELIQKQRPWYLALTFEALELMRLGFDPKYGIDIHFLSRAQGNKKIKELESLNEQINLLSGFSDPDQELLLLYTLKDLNIVSGEMDDLMKAWGAGDVKGIESILTRAAKEEPKLAPMLKKLIDDRNTKMVSKIEGFLKTREIYFVVVGAGHLVGKKGIIDMLKEKGYLVQQL
jgi:hypothetical protein